MISTRESCSLQGRHACSYSNPKLHWEKEKARPRRVFLSWKRLALALIENYDTCPRLTHIRTILSHPNPQARRNSEPKMAGKKIATLAKSNHSFSLLPIHAIPNTCTVPVRKRKLVA
ncbi:hypothetical protein EYC84_011544 [Monilinia fructicola]|uniref:Uncharacterized protein n=1 Tax=Monilinia fructicola TaxID=38448 RepID=A0A5M9J8L8_MONFR|nr:hypothetical protein EYC84_011544 [Monilinia fructicola]